MASVKRNASFHELSLHMEAARQKVRRFGVDMNRIESAQPWLRKVDLEFHKRLKRAGIHVETATREGKQR